MYREESWFEGHYIDNHKKYKCNNCGKQFIVGEKLIENCRKGFPICPYCGQNLLECIAWTEDGQLQELAFDMGCLAICVDAEDAAYKRLAQIIRKYPDNKSLAVEVEGLGRIQDIGTIHNLADFLESMLEYSEDNKKK